MKLEWHEIEPGTYQARAGGWLLEVGRDDDAKPWRVWVGLLNERGADAVCGTTYYRRDVTGSLDEAQRAAVALAVEKCAPFVSTARAEAALAEREVLYAHLTSKAIDAAGSRAEFRYDDPGYDRADGAETALSEAAAAIRARTTPATLSNDTLAAIAEARGLRVVQPERLAELEAAARDAAAERNAGAANLVWERSRRDAHDKAQKIARTETQETVASSVAVAVMAERDACAAEVDAFAAQVQSEIDSTWPVGHKLDQLVAARTVLQKAVAMIRARSNSDRAATASPAPERS